MKQENISVSFQIFFFTSKKSFCFLFQKVIVFENQYLELLWKQNPFTFLAQRDGFVIVLHKYFLYCFRS
jgi:hypothetical protein